MTDDFFGEPENPDEPKAELTQDEKQFDADCNAVDGLAAVSADQKSLQYYAFAKQCQDRLQTVDERTLDTFRQERRRLALSKLQELLKDDLI